MNNFSQRAFTALVFVAVLISCILYNHFSFSILFLFFTVVGLNEFYKLSFLGDSAPQKYYGILLGASFFIFSALISMQLLSIKFLLLFLPLLYISFILELFRKRSNPFRNIAFTMLGVIYVAVPFALLNFILTSTALENYEPRILIGILLILWASDTGAYLVGSKIGKRKLFERISPKKSWEGSIGGALLSLLAAYVDSQLFLFFPSSHWYIIACIIVVMGTLGDLVESLFKRSSNVKDSGSILPGHGGVLDRFDSLILSSPFIYAYLQWFV